MSPSIYSYWIRVVTWLVFKLKNLWSSLFFFFFLISISNMYEMFFFLVLILKGPQGHLLQVCLDNDSIAKSFGVEEQLKFVNISYPNFTGADIANAFQFNSLINFSNSIDNTSFSSFDGIASLYYDPNGTAEEQAKYYALTNVTETTIDMISAEKNGRAAINRTLLKLKHQTESVLNMTNALKGDATNFSDGIKSCKHVLYPLVDKAEWIIEHGQCGFIGKAYFGMKTETCETIV
ncbi:hypothetical protein RFI_27744 [Reticulomyxa filosa]|uniref:Uncharacterized protein n=1 Tax=Reticulomyxa filosa TaxID=46433 RepID=X6M7J9_RETFI|nr:hypothetical protein RFI_27744 [Reticulomyxa filosa]|eukprot:ETO09636.1 hypothetical protein RFI_27744 [Reticulomyxa filosa]